MWPAISKLKDHKSVDKRPYHSSKKNIIIPIWHCFLKLILADSVVVGISHNCTVYVWIKSEKSFAQIFSSCQCEPTHSHLVIITSKCSASDHPGSAPRADHHFSSPGHVSEPTSSNDCTPHTASTCKCVRLAPEWAWMDLYMHNKCSALLVCVLWNQKPVFLLRCCCNPSSSRLSLCCWPLWSTIPAWSLLWPHPWPPPPQYRALHCR